MSQNDIDRRVLAQASDSVSGSTPLMFAAIENKMQVMERLLNLGCDINKRNKENYTALHFGKIPCLRLFANNALQNVHILGERKVDN